LDSDSIFQPDGVQLFLTEALGRNALYIPGEAAKFRGLVSWQKVNRLLAYGGLTYPRLRVIQGNQALSPDAYSRIGRSGYARLLVAELTALLRDGALLAIDAIDQLDEQVAELCRTLEKALGIPVTAELYGSWPDSSVRPPLWDDNETLLFQVEGKKQWSLYEPTAYYPMAEMELPEPQGPPRWHGVVQAGDLVYIPRGWWYRDSALGEPSLYLAVRFANPRGFDIVLRLGESLRRKEVVKMDIPRFRTADRQSRYMTTLQQEVINAITLPGIFKGVLDDIQKSSEPLVEFNLPWNVQSDPLPPSADYQLVMLSRFSTIESLIQRRGNGWIDILHNGHTLRFDDQITRILERLCKLPIPTLCDLLEECRTYLSEERILGHVSDLISKGLLSARVPVKNNAS